MTKKIKTPIYYEAKITDENGTELNYDDLSSEEQDMIFDNPFGSFCFRGEEDE
mgnify:CR=1 FL=1